MIIAFLILFAALAGIFLIREGQVETDATAQTTKVGVLLSGVRWDRNYCQTHYEAMEAIREKLNLDIVYREHVPEDCYQDVVELVRNEGCQIIVGVSYDFRASIEKAAEDFPEIYFLHASGISHRHNLSSYFGRMYQARYLAGIVAGHQTQTGELGYVAAFPIPEVIRGINAFTLGVRSVRPDAVVHVSYCGSWIEDRPAEEAGRELLDEYPIDVMAMHTNSISPNRLANTRGIWSIGCNLDNGDLYPDTYLMACEWRWEGYYYRQILDILQKKFHGSNKWYDMETGIVGISDFSPHVSMQTRTEVQAVARKLKNWTFDVFYGPIRDNTGQIRVEAGESMTDDEMLNNFDWYVEGVKIEGQGTGLGGK